MHDSSNVIYETLEVDWTRKKTEGGGLSMGDKLVTVVLLRHTH